LAIANLELKILYNQPGNGGSMHKLVILVDEVDSLPSFDEGWPEFLSLAEQMPGLEREATSRVDRVVFGKSDCSLIHELFFDSLEALRQGMNSAPGLQAGQVLQKLTQGKLTLLIADHKEDDLVNIRSHTRTPENDDAPAP
jgi:hypothetical protein